MALDMKSLNEQTGENIQYAARDLPPGYQIVINIEKDAGTVELIIDSQNESTPAERVTEFAGDNIADEIRNATEYAIEHYADLRH